MPYTTIPARLWDAWVEDDSPEEFLAAVDSDVAWGTYASRREAFLDHVRVTAREPGRGDGEDPEAVAEQLLAHAEAATARECGYAIAHW